MTQKDDTVAPESTATRTAMWRALHVRVDAPPYVFEDEVGLQLLEPADDWQKRGDMDVQFTKPFRASIVARARFIEDLIIEQAAHGLTQYVILGAGIDTFAQRKLHLAPDLDVFEIDLPGPQEWKKRRLIESGLGISEHLHLIPFRFEAGRSWLDALTGAGFEPHKKAVVVSTGVSMYLTRDANAATLKEVASLAKGSIFAMTFLLPLEMADPVVRPGLEMAVRGAEKSGTPFISYFEPDEILALAHEYGFSIAKHVSADALTAQYFANRSDGLRPPANAEELLIAMI